MKRISYLYAALSGLLFSLQSTQAATLPEPAKGVTVALKSVPLDQLKDWTLPPTLAIKFDGTVPLPAPGGKPQKAKFDADGITVINPYSGAKIFKPGDKWEVDVLYPDQVSGKYTLLVEKSGEGLSVRSYQAQVGTFLSMPVALIDVNSNGRFDDVGIDVVMIDKSTQMKVGDKIVIAKEELDAIIAPSGTSITLGKSMGFGNAITQGTTDIEGALASWNLIREAVGSPALKRDSTLEEWGAKHIEYMKGIGQLSHPEDKSNPKYSAEGNKSGMGSCLGWGSGTPKDALMGQLTCFLHRVPLITPPLETTGIAFDAGSKFAVFDWNNGPKRKGFAWTKPIAYPPDGATEFAPGWAGNEGPCPIPGGPPAGGVGQPVTLTFPDHAKIKNAKITLTETGGAELEGYTSDPEHPAVEMFRDNLDSIVFIAKSPLKTGTVYQAKVTAEINGQPFEKEWSFTTSKRGGFIPGGRPGGKGGKNKN